MIPIMANEIENFYIELINRFFHNESYFYLCTKNHINNTLHKNNSNNPQQANIVLNLINYLVESKQPTQELEEISKLKGFNSLYFFFIESLQGLNIKTIQRSKLKTTIQNFAIEFIKNINATIANNSENESRLASFLNIKNKLKNLINNDSIYTNEIEKDITQKQNILNSKKEVFSFETIEDNFGKKQNSLLQKNFESELKQLLNRVYEFSTQKQLSEDIIKQLHDSKKTYRRIEEVSMFYGFDEIEVIAKRCKKFIIDLLENRFMLNEKAVSLLSEAKLVIDNLIFKDHNIDNFHKILNYFDKHNLNIDDDTKKYILNEKTDFSKTTITENKVISSADQTIKIVDNPIVSNIPVNKKILDSIPPTVVQVDDNIKKNKNEFTMPGEEDIELLSLIEEIGNTMISTNETITVNSSGNDASLTTEKVLDSLAIGLKEEHPNFRFNHEAHLYYNLISNAIIKLRINSENQLPLEDLELANFSLKHLAIKFGLEKIAILPEIIESICLQVNKKNRQMPEPILKLIDSGIELLKIFDEQNQNHKKDFIDIYSKLKEFYILSLNKKLNYDF